MNEPDSDGPGTRFRGLLRAQGLATLAVGLLVSIVAGPDQILVALWGGAISVLAFAWAGFQLWLHPGNRRPERLAGSAIRAEAGKVIIVLVLFWLTLKSWPATRTGSTAVILVLAFLWTYVAGLVWLHRRSREDGATTGPANTDEHRDQ